MAEAPEKPIPFVCPRDHVPLSSGDSELACPGCGARYPVVDGVPVLIDDANSVFAVADYLGGAGYGGASYGRLADRAPRLRRLARRAARRLREVGLGPPHFGHDDALAAIRRAHLSPDVLVVGSGGLRYGRTEDRVVHTDVAFGPHVDAIVDAHDSRSPTVRSTW